MALTDKMNLTQAQLFIDNAWIEDSIRVQRVFHQPQKFPKPVLEPDQPGEQSGAILYGTVLFRQNRFHLWYVTWSRNICYAVSRDGITFEKPALGIYEYEGSRRNNICLMLAPPAIIDNISIIEDRDDAEWPLKAIFYQGRMPAKEMNGLSAGRSKDGIHWDLTPGLVLAGFGDRTNAVATKIAGKFVVLTRVPNNPYECRMVWRVESDDLIHWSEPELIFKPDLEDDSRLEIYSATAFKYESLYLGFIERMQMRPDKLDSELIYSHDSHVWRRTRSRNCFISWGPAEAFDSVWLSMPTNGPLNVNNNLWFYYSGRSAAHGSPYPLNYGAIGLAIMRPDGFASLFSGHGEGWIVTPPVKWPEKDLFINADPRRDLTSHPHCPKCQGAVRVEVRDADQRALQGYRREDCRPILNTRDYPLSRAPVLWQGDKSMRSLAGRTIRLAFYLQDAHLYSFAAGDTVKR